MALPCWLPSHPCKSQGSHAAGRNTHSAMTWEGHGAGDEVTSFWEAGNPGKSLGILGLPVPLLPLGALSLYPPEAPLCSWVLPLSQTTSLLQGTLPSLPRKRFQASLFRRQGLERPQALRGQTRTCWRPSCRRPPSPVCGIASPPSVPGQRALGLEGARWQPGLTRMTCCGA